MLSLYGALPRREEWEMALINCPECGGKISEFAEVCPHCGFPMEYEGMEEALKKFGPGKMEPITQEPVEDKI